MNKIPFFVCLLFITYCKANDVPHIVSDSLRQTKELIRDRSMENKNSDFSSPDDSKKNEPFFGSRLEFKLNFPLIVSAREVIYFNHTILGDNWGGIGAGEFGLGGVKLQTGIYIKDSTTHCIHRTLVGVMYPWLWQLFNREQILFFGVEYDAAIEFITFNIGPYFTYDMQGNLSWLLSIGIGVIRL